MFTRLMLRSRESELILRKFQRLELSFLKKKKIVLFLRASQCQILQSLNIDVSF